MNVYTVHVKGSPGDAAAIERAVFVREGFGWAAFIFGPLWLLWNRLWLGLLIWLVAELCIIALGAFALTDGSATVWLGLLLQLAFGFEAAQIMRGSLRRRGYRLVDVVHGHRLADAERVYFERAVADRPAVSPARPFVSTQPPGMVGLFPSAGA